MQLKEKSLEQLKLIIQRDYGVDLNDEEAYQLSISLLKLSQLAAVALNRKEDKHIIAGNQL